MAHRVEITNPLNPPNTAPPQQIVILAGNANTSSLASGTQVISIDPSQLSQILAMTQQQQQQNHSAPLPYPKD